MISNILHSPSFGVGLNSNALRKRSLSTTLTAKTRVSATHIAYASKKQLPQAQVVQGMKSISLKAKIPTRQIIADFHRNSTCYMSFRSYYVGASLNQVESEKDQLFISFRGETRTRFTGHLYKRLTLACYPTIIDETMIRGENIEKVLFKAIRDSAGSVVVISPGFASSPSCLNEVVEILRCKKCFGHKLLVVFYLVDPDEVRNQTGEFGAAFNGLIKYLEKAKDYKMVIQYKKALKEISDVMGLVHRQNESETVLIDKIIAEVEKQLRAPPEHVPSFVVGWRCLTYGLTSWLQTALSIVPYIIVGMVAAFKRSFRGLNEGLMTIRLGIAISVYLHSLKRTCNQKNSLKRTDKLGNDGEVNSVCGENDSLKL